MANVLFRRGTQEYINNNVPISDGQVVFNETDQAIYVDTPVNNVITRLRYGGGNLSRSDIDSALSDTSENPVQNKVITESVLQKTDVVNDYNTAVAVTATDIPVGCGVIKTTNTKIGNLQSALNTTNGTVSQHTTDIQALNTGLTSKIGTASTASSTASPIDLITWNEDIKRMVMRKRNNDDTYINYNVPSIATRINNISSLITINNSNFTLIEGSFMLYGHVALLTIHGRFTSSVPHNSLIMSCNRPIYEPSGVIRCSSRDEANHVTTLDMRNDDKIYTWGQAQANPSALYIFNFTYLVGNVGGI